MARKNESPKIDSGAGKAEALKMALASIEKQFGTGSIMMMSADHASRNVELIPTNLISFDLALGGGLPRGRIVEIYGPESSGKTSLANHVAAQVQKQGGVAAFVDAEHALDPEYARKLGVNLDQLLVSQPDSGEQALEITETLVRSNAVDVIIVDSVAALVPRAEIEGEMGDAMVGVQARLMSQALRKLTSAISRSKCIVIFINQIRMKIGVMFGNPETTSGGNALKFYASVRLDVRRIEQIKEGDEVIGNRVRVKVVKNKVAPPFRTAEFDLLFSEGFSKEGDLLDVGANLGVVTKAGSWYTYGDTRLGQGKEGARTFLKQNVKIYDEIHDKVVAETKARHDAKNGVAQPEPTAPAETDEE